MTHDLEQRIKDYLQSHLKVSRYQHSLATADCAKELACRWGVAPQQAYLAGLCHDVAKGKSQAESLTYMRGHGMVLDSDTMANPALWHAPLGAVLTKELFEITDTEILAAIRNHTVGKPDMTCLEKIIFLADLVEPGRDFPGVDELRALVKQDLDRAMAKALKINIDFVTAKGGQVHPYARLAYEVYRNKTMGSDGMPNVEELLQKCAGYILEKKGQDILSLDLREISTMADYFLLCTVGNTPQAKAVADYIKEKMAEEEPLPLRVEGYKDGRWILMDYGSLIVHIFQQDERLYYNLERLWGDAVKTAYGPKENR